MTIDWKDHQKKWETSGLTKSQYATQAGLSKSTFYNSFGKSAPTSVRKNKSSEQASFLSIDPGTVFAAPQAQEKSPYLVIKTSYGAIVEVPL